MTNYQLVMTLLLRGSSFGTIQAHCDAAHATLKNLGQFNPYGIARTNYPDWEYPLPRFRNDHLDGVVFDRIVYHCRFLRFTCYGESYRVQHALMI